MKIKSTFKQINIIATQYAHSILVHKCRIENRQPITNLQDYHKQIKKLTTRSTLPPKAVP